MNTVFSPEQQTIRTWWLGIFLLQIAVSIFSILYKLPHDTLAKTVNITTALLSSYGIYRCGYKKQGTKLLTIVLLFSLTNFIILIVKIFGLLLTFSPTQNILLPFFATPYSIIAALCTLLTGILQIPFFFLTLRLLKINRESKQYQIQTEINYCERNSLRATEK